MLPLTTSARFCACLISAMHSVSNCPCTNLTLIAMAVLMTWLLLPDCAFADTTILTIRLVDPASEKSASCTKVGVSGRPRSTTFGSVAWGVWHICALLFWNAHGSLYAVAKSACRLALDHMSDPSELAHTGTQLVGSAPWRLLPTTIPLSGTDEWPYPSPTYCEGMVNTASSQYMYLTGSFRLEMVTRCSTSDVDAMRGS